MADIEPQPKPTRVDRALKAWQASCERRALPDEPTNRMLEVFMGRRSVTDLDGSRRFITVDDELEHLRLWTVFEAAREHPLLELCAVFDIHKPLNNTERVVGLRARLDLRHIPRRPEFVTELGIDRRDVMRSDPDEWLYAAQMAVREWLRATEFQIVEALDHGQ